MCDHDWEYEGVRFKIGHQLSGSSARSRAYYDSYFCKKCLEHKYIPLNEWDNTFYTVRFNARPMPSGSGAE